MIDIQRLREKLQKKSKEDAKMENKLYKDWALQLKRFHIYFRQVNIKDEEKEQIKKECEEIVSAIENYSFPPYTEHYLINSSSLFAFNEAFRNSGCVDILEYTERYIDENFEECYSNRKNPSLTDEQRERLIKLGKIGVNRKYIPYQLYRSNKADINLILHIKETKEMPITVYSKLRIPLSLFKYFEGDLKQYQDFLKFLWERNIEEFPSENFETVINQLNDYFKERSIEAKAELNK